MGITIEVNGIEKTVASLDKIAANARDLRPAFKVAKVLVLESVNRNFMVGGRPKWKSLSPATIERRMRDTRGYRQYRSGANKGRITEATARNIGAAGFQILRDTGALMTSLDLDRKETPAINEMTTSTLRVGTNVPYAGPNQATRPFIILQEADVENIVQVIADHVAGPK